MKYHHLRHSGFDKISIYDQDGNVLQHITIDEAFLEDAVRRMYGYEKEGGD